MATTVTLTSPCDANLSRSLAYAGENTHIRDASFSSYLSSTEETFILKLAEMTRNPSPTIAGAEEPPSHYQISLGRKNKRDGEISVFGAERYFNGGMDDDTPRIVEKIAAKEQHQRDERPDLQFVKRKIKYGTPSTCSEVSGNSQSALLPSFLRDQSPNKQNRLQSKRFFVNFGCNCSCADKKSIDVEEKVGEGRISRNCKSNVDYGGFYGKEMIIKEPNKTHQAPIDLVGIRVKQNQFKEDMLCEKFNKLRFSVVEMEEEEEKTRESLDVFGSPIRDLKLNQERGLDMLPWNGISKIKDNPATSGNCGNRIYDDLDMESDASSDLFEIESLSGNTNRCLTRQASDGMSSCVTSTYYEPSEASIDWSVVTASAANFSTVSDHDERGSVSSALKIPNLISNTTTNAATTTTTTTKTTMTQTRTTSTSAKEWKPSILSGCRNHKAVKVAADAYKMSEKGSNPNTRRRGGLSDPLVPIARFQAETKAIDSESTNQNWGAFTTRSLPQSKLAHASHLLYMP
ncbi:protein PHYTOCHROME KINASE SUBSTRATE 1-like [Telopea speciosissima]|uniref:protein PHYTOCHROME KINASE SUBSTRATE 1-like n=1 Tax=Telopea speciosissima TaxID=54955 RepID=UPI001CC3613C|nr:protein PHYTOCHROME KINASE SUBSTRATE 1-like [Telopea speciosissima]